LPNYPYDDLGTPLDVTELEKLNNNYDAIQADIQSVSSASIQAVDALEADVTSKLLTQKNEYTGRLDAQYDDYTEQLQIQKTDYTTKLNVQKQVINNLVVDGDSSPEAAQARVGFDGTDYPTLKDRIDDEITDISVAQINKNKGKFDQSYMTDEFLQQIAGSTPINASPATRSLTSGVFAFKSISPELISFFKQSKNLFDPSVATAGYQVNITTGVLDVATTYTTSDFIPVLPSTAYSRSQAWNMAFYTKDKNFISGRNDQRQFTTPANTAFVRVSFSSGNLYNYQLELGSTETSYEAYKMYTDDTKNITFTKGFIEKSFEQFSIEKTDALEPGKNLFDKNKATTGFYIDYTAGTLSGNATYFATDYIAVLPSQAYSINFDGQMAWYNSSKQYVSGVNGLGFAANKTITSPSVAAFARFSTKDKDTFQVEKGNSATAYEPFKKVIKSDLLPSTSVPIGTDEVLLFLPPELPIAVGRTIELYNSQVVWAGNIENYHIKWACAVGSAFKRKWSCTGVTEKIGDHTLTCTVYNNNMVQVAQGTTTVKIVNTTLTTTKKLLCIGDSLTNRKAWMPELNTLVGGKIQFVGSRLWTSGATTYGHEGRSGFTAGNYLTASTYPFEGEGVQPFWNPSTSSFDYAYYKTQTGVNPDAIQIFLGTNGIALDPTVNAGNIKTIVDKIRQVDAVIPIYVVFTLYRGDQNGMGRQLSSDGYSAGSGVWKLEEDRKVYNLMVKLYDLLKLYSNLRFIPIAHTHDSEYNFYNGTTYPVNPRSTIMEPQQIEATHPQNPGYFQMSDIIYSTWCLYND